MSALEIVAIVVLCILGVGISMICMPTALLFDKILDKYREEEKKPTSKSEEDKKQL